MSVDTVLGSSSGRALCTLLCVQKYAIFWVFLQSKNGWGLKWPERSLVPAPCPPYFPLDQIVQPPPSNLSLPLFNQVPEPRGKFCAQDYRRQAFKNLTSLSVRKSFFFFFFSMNCSTFHLLELYRAGSWDELCNGISESQQGTSSSLSRADLKENSVKPVQTPARRN